jgi:hypothetical protein
VNVISRPTEPSRMATAEDWATLMRPLLAALNSKPSREEFNARAVAMAFALPDVPADMLTGWRQRDLVRRFKFLPSPAEIEEWLSDALRDRKATAALLSLPAPKPEPRAERTPEEIAEARAKVQAFMAERNAAGGPAELAPVEPRYLSDGHLLASLEKIAAEGGPCAGASRLRANALRARMQAQRVSA